MIDRKFISDITEEIVKVVIPQKVILVGSYVYGNPTKDSDLDLLVFVKESNLPRYKRAREIRKHLWGYYSVPMDILVYTEDEVQDWSNVKQAFITSVVNKGKILYENNF